MNRSVSRPAVITSLVQHMVTDKRKRFSYVQAIFQPGFKSSDCTFKLVGSSTEQHGKKRERSSLNILRLFKWSLWVIVFRDNIPIPMRFVTASQVIPRCSISPNLPGTIPSFIVTIFLLWGHGFWNVLLVCELSFHWAFLLPHPRSLEEEWAEGKDLQ